MLELEALLAIIIPAVSYVVSGIIMIIKVVNQIKAMSKKNEADKEITNSELAKLEDQLKIEHQDNEALRHEVRRLTNKVDKIMEE